MTLHYMEYLEGARRRRPGPTGRAMARACGAHARRVARRLEQLRAVAARRRAAAGAGAARRRSPQRCVRRIEASVVRQFAVSRAQSRDRHRRQSSHQEREGAAVGLRLLRRAAGGALARARPAAARRRAGRGKFSPTACITSARPPITAKSSPICSNAAPRSAPIRSAAGSTTRCAGSRRRPPISRIPTAPSRNSTTPASPWPMRPASASTPMRASSARRRRRAASSLCRRPGYFGARLGDDYLVVDCGRIGPDDLPAHAHGDVLSFELSIAGHRIIVDQGVYEYVAGDAPAPRAHRREPQHAVRSTAPTWPISSAPFAAAVGPM